jgi:hypothetical protein
MYFLGVELGVFMKQFKKPSPLIYWTSMNATEVKDRLQSEGVNYLEFISKPSLATSPESERNYFNNKILIILQANRSPCHSEK